MGNCISENKEPAADASGAGEPNFSMMPFCQCFARRVNFFFEDKPKRLNTEDASGIASALNDASHSRALVGLPNLSALDRNTLADEALGIVAQGQAKEDSYWPQ